MASIDLLNLQPTVISRDLAGKYILLAGVPKIGKTEFVTQCPNVLVLATEIGTNARPGTMVQPITTWSDYKLCLRQLEKPELKAKFKTIGIDTITILYDLCEKFICAQNGVQKIGDIPYGGGYAALSKEFEDGLRKVTMFGYGLVMTCHLKDTVIGEDEENEIHSYKPDLNNRCLKIVNGLVDVIGVITQEWNDMGISERYLITRATPYINAGSRYKYLAPKIPFGYDHLSKAIADAIDKEAAMSGATVVDHVDAVAEEKVSYDALRAEAQELWAKLVMKNGETDEDMARRILKRVEMVFGRPIKLSEITEDQVDLYQLVLLDLRELAAENC